MQRIVRYITPSKKKEYEAKLYEQMKHPRERMFEKKLEELWIIHKLIKPKTPRHNEKVERSHRKDKERFYYNNIFYSFEDFKNRLKYWERVYNDFPMKPLKWLSPNEKYLEYIKG